MYAYAEKNKPDAILRKGSGFPTRPNMTMFVATRLIKPGSTSCHPVATPACQTGFISYTRRATVN